ncbi:DNA repair protein RecN [Scatolibacter rhodanostii]|uniref:DNA repair protein RecN n=1 Tax=Scatolibacter rhodanostii TaxID=2014781 RepID=UPI000C076327|nr:DNA repair protein RecN [Scatolibacter rhodanostii]
MLSQLFINKIAVIDKASIDFERGFTVLTGETGAGKSIIIDAIHVLLGERASKDLIRTGEKMASVSAVFSDLPDDILSLAESFGVPVEDDASLLIYREIRTEGKSACKINGAPVTVAMLKEIGQLLVSIHGQHESYELLSEHLPIQYIDSFGELASLLTSYQNSYHKLKEIQKRLDSFNSDEGEKARQIDLLRYQIEEISSADIHVGEQDELITERNSIRNHEKISSSVEKTQNLLVGDEERNGILSDITMAAEEMESLSEWLADAEKASQKLREAQYLLEDADEIIREINVDFDTTSLDIIENRLDLLHKLHLKYGTDEEQILSYLITCEQKLHDIEFADEEREKLETEYEKEKEKAILLAKQLSGSRKKAAERFAKQVKEELQFLNMLGFEFLVEVSRVPLNNKGCDKVQFLVSANKGEPPKPMSKIASGGELSRIMLSIKTVLSGKDNIDTLIFDEIDTGISGEAANKVGEKLRHVSLNRQVICITHLAQMASFADNHLFIAKNEREGRTFTEVTILDENKRIDELARIIGGNEITELKRKMAKEMLDKVLDK